LRPLRDRAGRRVIAVMRLAGFGQPSEDCSISAAISNAIEFLGANQVKSFFDFGIRVRLPLDVAVVIRSNSNNS
jgi:hypothetical protein